MTEKGEQQPLPYKKKEKVNTIDDMVVAAGKLYKGLMELSNQKHPLDIRKGVMSMYNERKDGEVIKTAGKTYFLDIEKTKTGKPYLKITESRKDSKSGDPIRNTIIVFQEDVRLFAQAINRVSYQIGIDEHDK